MLVTLPLIPLFMALVGWYTDRQTRAKWASLSRLAGHFTDVVAGLPTLKVFGRAKAQAAGGAAGHRRLPQVVDGDAAGGVPVLDGAGAAGLAVGRAGRGRDRPAAGLRRPDAAGGPGRADPGARRPTCRCASSAPSSTPPRTGSRPPAKVLASWTHRRRSPAPARDLPAPFRDCGWTRVTVGSAGERGAVGPLTLGSSRPAGSPWSPGTAGPARPRCCSCSPGC